MAVKELTEIEEIDIKQAKEYEAHADSIGPRHTITLTPEQTEYIEAGQCGFKEVLFSGGVRSGKTLAMCVKMAEYLAVPHTTVVLVGANATDLWRTTVKTLLYGERKKDGSFLPPFYPPQAIARKNTITGTIDFYNQSQLIVLGCADVTKIRSINVAACFVEELHRLSKDSYVEVALRPSQYHPLGNVTYSAVNPLHRGHWIWKYYVNERVATRKMICVSTESNKINLPDGYIESKAGLAEEYRKRMLDGLWSDTADGVFCQYTDDKTVAPCQHMMNLQDMADIVIGQDLGGGSAWAGFVVAGRSHDGKIYCFLEHSQKATTIRQALAWQNQFKALTNATMIYDSRNARFGATEAELEGWHCIPSHNDVEGTVDLMNDYFSEGRIVIDPSCTTLRQEIQEAFRNPDSGRWVKTKQCDVVDAFRYAAWHLSDREATARGGSNFYFFQL